MFGAGHLEKREIGIYKIDTSHLMGRWEICPGPFPVTSVFAGHSHQTLGNTDWHLKHQRLVSHHAEFNVEFTIPPSVVSHHNKVFLAA